MGENDDRAPPPNLREAFGRFLRRMPRQARSKAMVEAMVIALDDLLQRGDTIDELTLSRLVHRAGVGIGSFYEYFSNKDALLGALIGQVTRDNFNTLLRELERADVIALDALIDHVSMRVAHTYLDHPVRMRTIFIGVGRLGLLGTIVEERDRFAGRLALRMQPYMSDEPLTKIEHTMRIVSDSAIGMIAGALYRDPTPTAEELGHDLGLLARSLVHARHADALASRT